MANEYLINKSINRLTVIANESYDDFAKALQKEIEDDCGVSFAGRIKNKEKNPAIKYRKGFELDENFKDIWERIKYKTTYRVSYDTEELIKQASHAVHTLPTIHAPEIRSEKTKLNMTSKGI